jgi:integrase
MNKLTVKAVEKQTKPGLYGDGGGLYLQITKQGVKSWLYRFMIDGKAYGMGLGATHTITLAEARQKATDARKLVINGGNPLEAKRLAALQAKAAKVRLMTFAECANAYIEAHKVSWRNAKHQDQWVNTIESYVNPIIGTLPVSEVDTALVMKVLTQSDADGLQFWQSKNETANRVRGRIEAILGWATTSGFRSGDNPARWKGHLINLLATISRVERIKHRPSLPWERIGAFFCALKQTEGIAARAVEFTILTASRSGEVRGAKWSEIDLKKKVWTIPASRMKAKQEHEVPLSSSAIDLIQKQERIPGSDVIFPNTKGDVLSDMALTAVIRRMDKKDPDQWKTDSGDIITVHGFRSTFRMWAAEATNYPREVAEHALAHKLPDAVERSYQRGSQFSKRSAMMEDWASYCSTPPVNETSAPS